eukprot:1701434-Alexandrium_andersonii.AAC.1
MSASLVGSEMCIRDSSFTAQPQCTIQRSSPTKNAESLGSVSSGHGGNRPVSYTHLTLPTICSV